MQSPRPGPPALEQDPGAANPREHTGGLGSRAVYLLPSLQLIVCPRGRGVHILAFSAVKAACLCPQRSESCSFQ